MAKVYYPENWLDKFPEFADSLLRYQKEGKNVHDDAPVSYTHLKGGKVADVEAIKNFMALKGKNITVQQAIALQLMQKALKGDLKAIEMVFAMTGDKPADKVQVEAKIRNPMAGLSTEELRQIIAIGEGKNADEL